MKYLLLGALVSFVTLGHAQSLADDLFAEGKAYNDEVSRKFNLAAEGVVEVTTDITFKTGKGVGSEPYYYVIPSDSYEGHFVSINAVLSNNQAEVPVKKIQPSEVKNPDAKVAIS